MGEGRDTGEGGEWGRSEEGGSRKEEREDRRQE